MSGARALIRLTIAVTSGYALLWGVTWLTGDRSYGAFGWSGDGEFHRYPGVFLGGLPPLPWPISDAPQALAAIGGFAGLVVLATDEVRRRRARDIH